MYTLALAVFLGLIASQVTAFALVNVPALEKVPVLRNGDNWFIAVSILVVWLTNTSILGAYGIASNAEWIDTVGSGLVVAGLANVTNALVNSFDK